ncbi:DUF3987 domain-containing protein [Stutzerimonas stutzeri]|uniref:DUF3987 domain-containing protein n=1 Tax=Stutzerimonas stutzeri TaxID=316 RepID=UPI002446B6A2|nr:DUF3987 domain-containing protein [Stutzerimonas stutzeri]MDH0081512.1 YfjI family protein [Stutzerimonas stutzeri]
MSYRGEKWNKECDVVLDDDRISISSLPLLSSAINEAERNIQAPRGLLLNAALTAASIALQGLIDVNKPNNQKVPVSLMLLAIANSGERKSTADNVFLRSIREFQSKQAVALSAKLQDWRAAHDGWSVRRKAVLRNVEKTNVERTID